jgi:hypothetical protein
MALSNSLSLARGSGLACASTQVNLSLFKAA